MRLEAWLAETRAWSESWLERALETLPPGPAPLEEAVRYALFGGGKRLRPALVRMVAHQLAPPDLATEAIDEAAGLPAAAVELVHTYSLVHDDLPCMDDDDLRRGRATCHKVFGEALAVLVGDTLLTSAFGILASTEHGAALVRALARGAGAAGMVGGQVLDLNATGGDLALEGVREIHRMKTAALIAAAVELGTLAALGPEIPEEPEEPEEPGDGAGGDPRRGAMRAYGEALGLCFQAVDDVLDVTGSQADLGKTPGKDAAAEKATLISALGLEGARREGERLAEVARAAAREAGAEEGDLPLALVDAVLDRTR